MHPVAAQYLANTIVDERVKQAEMVRLAQQARAAETPERGERPSRTAERLLADASKWVKARIASTSAG
jgi:hypothetical protein